MRKFRNQIPIIPHADWLDRNNRFEHLRSLYSERSGQRFMPPPFGARIITPEAGEPARVLPQNSSQSPDGMFVSRKNREAMFWEAKHERHAFWLMESDYRVVRYAHQPHLLEMTLPSKVYSYFPDALFTDDRGRTVIVETKFDYHDATRDTEYVFKLLLAEIAYSSFGYEFEIWTDVEDMCPSIGLRNAKAIIGHLNDYITTDDELRLTWHFGAAGDVSTVSDVCKALVEYPELVAKGKLFAWLARRRLAIDIFSGPILGTTPVRLVEERGMHHASQR